MIKLKLDFKNMSSEQTSRYCTVYNNGVNNNLKIKKNKRSDDYHSHDISKAENSDT